MQWTNDDPGAGDADGIAALASVLGEVGGDASSAEVKLQKLKDQASDAIWRGTSADSFRDRIDKLPDHLRKLASSYQDAARGFRAYAAAVRHIEHQASLAKAEISSVSSQVSSTAHQQAEYVAPAGTPAGAVNPYDEALASARSQVSSATSRLHALGGDRAAADSAVKGSLQQARDDGMKNKSGWVHFWEGVSDVLSVITIVLTVLAVVAVVILCVVQPELIPALLLIAGQVGTVLGAAQVVSDGALIAGGEDIPPLQLALDVAGAIPGLGAGKGAVEGAETAAKTASAVERGGADLAEGASALRSADDLVPSDSVDLIHQRLSSHTETAVAKYDSGELLPTPGDQRSLDRGMHPNTVKGTTIDTHVKELAANDPYLQSRGVTSTPRGGQGPDFINPNPLAHEKDWYDVTTSGQWNKHVKTYDGSHPGFDPAKPDYGHGASILWNSLPGGQP